MLHFARTFLIALGFMASTAMADYTVSRSTQLTDGQNGSSTFSTKGTFSSTSGTRTIDGGFTNFVLMETPRIKATGDVKSTNTVTKEVSEHTLNGKLTLAVATTNYNVEFQSLKVSRVGNLVTFSGTLLVNGTAYPFGSGSLPANIVNSIITYLEQ